MIEGKMNDYERALAETRTASSHRRTPSQRVHTVFHRIGIVSLAVCFGIATVLAPFAIWNFANGNGPTAGAQLIGSSIGLIFIGIVLYSMLRALGWIIAGAMAE
jgi:hypothetical protein